MANEDDPSRGGRKTRSNLLFAHLRFAISLPFIVLIRAYQIVLGPVLGGRCRFSPTCSEYALEAYRVHNPVRATWLAVWRILRCNPFGGHGYDPVPLPRQRPRPPA
jgi:putative membrane protein insertion efficiency factor